ncbi:VPS37B subunit of ESCRT-I a [Trichomycterus rosablanca]|uniref:VPS37B subunit of ESCRT-I a n=1 Tax=Trichomycterus rosablanca TaxID=2290929 RepID=UPI002F3589DF
MARFGASLSSYSISQLSELLEDDEKLEQIVLDLDEVKELQQSKETTLTGNRNLAEQNLQLQPGLESRKSELTERYRRLQDGFESYQLRKSTLDHKSGNSSLDTLLALLQAEGAKIEEESENMADAFLDGAVSMDAFIDEYQNKRKLAHLRRVKIEKLQELVLKSPHILQSPLPTQPLPSLPPKSTPVQREPDAAPVLQPRRPPPNPPSRSPVSSQAQPAFMFSYPNVPFPPIPPRASQPQAGYSPLFMPQYAPPVPERSPRMTPQPGFIVQ